MFSVYRCFCSSNWRLCGVKGCDAVASTQHFFPVRLSASDELAAACSSLASAVRLYLSIVVVSQKLKTCQINFEHQFARATRQMSKCAIFLGIFVCEVYTLLRASAPPSAEACLRKAWLAAHGRPCKDVVAVAMPLRKVPTSLEAFKLMLAENSKGVDSEPFRNDSSHPKNLLKGADFSVCTRHYFNPKRKLVA
jgi:hypothetical protein